MFFSLEMDQEHVRCKRDSPEPNPLSAIPSCHCRMTEVCHYVIDMLKRCCRLAFLLVHFLALGAGFISKGADVIDIKLYTPYKL